MQTITKITQQKVGHRYNIELDGQFAFGVQESVLAKFVLHKGQVLSVDEIEKIKAGDLLARAFHTALQFISYTSRTKYQVSQRLQKDQVPEYVVDQVLKSLVDKNIVNDEAYASRYLDSQMTHQLNGPKKIALAMKTAGLSDQLIDQTLANYDEDAQIQVAHKIIDKSHKKYPRDSNQKRQQKLQQLLLTRGFDYRIAQIATENLIAQPEIVEYENLYRQTEKYFHKYAKYGKQQGYRTKQMLYSKGYSLSLIEKALQEIQELQDES